MPLSDDLDLRKVDFEAEVNVAAIGTVQSYSDLAPLLDELNKRHAWVKASVSSFEPPAAGMTEIAVTLALAAPVTYLKSFIETWATEDAKAVRAAVKDIVDKGRQNRHGRRFIPFRLELGGVRFYFHERLTDDTMQDRLRAAQVLIDSLPSEAFEGQPGPGEYGFFWDSGSNTWKGSIFGHPQYGSGICIPENLWDG